MSTTAPKPATTPIPRRVKILERALAPVVTHKEALPPIPLSSMAMLSIASRISRMASRLVIPQWG